MANKILWNNDNHNNDKSLNGIEWNGTKQSTELLCLSKPNQTKASQIEQNENWIQFTACSATTIENGVCYWRHIDKTLFIFCSIFYSIAPVFSSKIYRSNQYCSTHTKLCIQFATVLKYKRISKYLWLEEKSRVPRNSRALLEL